MNNDKLVPLTLEHIEEIEKELAATPDPFPVVPSTCISLDGDDYLILE